MSDQIDVLKVEKSGATGRIKAMTQKLSDLEGRIEETLERDIQLLEKGSKRMDKACAQFSKKHRLMTGFLLMLLGGALLVILFYVMKSYYS